MTKEEFKEKMASLNEQRNAIETEMRKVQQKYVESYPIKEGDVCKDGAGRKCWFKYLKFDRVGAYNAIAVVNYPKKDGARSNRDMYVYSELTKMEE